MGDVPIGAFPAGTRGPADAVVRCGGQRGGVPPTEGTMDDVLFTDKLSAVVRQAVYNVTDVVKQHHLGSDVLESYQTYNQWT